MSKFRNIPGLVWLVIGVLVTLLVIPSTAYAAALKFTGIEGTSTNKADVSPGGQLLTTSADPSASYNFLSAFSPDYTLAAQPPVGKALMITSLHFDVYSNPNPADDPYEEIALYSGSCVGFITTIDEVDPASEGVTVLPYDPGIPVPAGDSLCSDGVSLYGDLEASGYTVPSADVPAAAVRHSAPLARH